MDTRALLLLLPRSRPLLAPRPATTTGVRAACCLVPPKVFTSWPRQRSRPLSPPVIMAVAPQTTKSPKEEVELDWLSSLSPPVSARTTTEAEEVLEFDWLDQWYPFAPVCDLDPAAPHGKTVLGLRVVAWHDRNAGEWRVFNDACPHRLAPLSEGRIDGKGRLQCVYHGWCFDGRGSCEFIPQAPALGPPVHKSSKACASAYPTVVQNSILWFYPRAGAEHRDVLLQRKRPPFVPEMDDPSFTTAIGMRDFPFGYDVLMENLMDPAHVPYAHKGLVQGLSYKEDPGRAESDVERGGPLKIKIEDANLDGFVWPQENGGGSFWYAAPCTVHYSSLVPRDEKKAGGRRFMLVFMCVPVAPGRSRLIWAFPRNFGLLLDKIIPRWFLHIAQNELLDSDLYLLHAEERNFAAAGSENWHKAVYVPTSADAIVLAFRNWFRKHCNSQVGWAAPTVEQLPASPTRDTLMERYWSHVAQCASCSAALKDIKALEVTLHLASVAVLGFLAATLQRTSPVHRAGLVSLAVLCMAASRWLDTFVRNTFYFQDYVHAHK